MSIALVRLEKNRGGKVYHILDYISEDVARMGLEINGADHSPKEFAKPEIIKVFK